MFCQAIKHCGNLEVGRGVLEQLAFFIGKKNMYPAAKVFQTAIRAHKGYEKMMKEIGLADIVMAAIKNKETKGQRALEGVLKKNMSEFGYGNCHYIERSLLDSIDFLQAI